MSALSNPYAPPSDGPYVPPPGAALPADFRRFRLDPIAYRSFATRALLLRSAFVLGTTIAFAGLVVLVLPDSAYVFFVVPVVIALVLPTFVRVRSPRSPELVSYELLASPRVLRRTVVGLLPAEILRPEVTRIVESKLGLWVFSTTPLRALFVVSALDGYADVRAALATWRPIEPLAGGGRAARRLVRQSTGLQGSRDAVHGTSLAADASLREELELVRAVSSTAHQAVVPVAPRRRGVRVLLLWVLLIVMFLAIWQFLSPTPPSQSRPRAHPASTE
jgi:hypothetical protein